MRRLDHTVPRSVHQRAFLLRKPSPQQKHHACLPPLLRDPADDMVRECLPEGSVGVRLALADGEAGVEEEHPLPRPGLEVAMPRPLEAFDIIRKLRVDVPVHTHNTQQTAKRNGLARLGWMSRVD